MPGSWVPPPRPLGNGAQSVVRFGVYRADFGLNVLGFRRFEFGCQDFWVYGLRFEIFFFELPKLAAHLLAAVAAVGLKGQGFSFGYPPSLPDRNIKLQESSGPLLTLSRKTSC